MQATIKVFFWNRKKLTAMGVFKVIKAVVGGRRSDEVVAEPPVDTMSFDAMGWLFCIAMSLSLCFVVALAFRNADRETIVKEKNIEQKVSEEKVSEQEDIPEVPTPEAGELADKIIDADTKSGDTDDETETDSKTTEDPPTPVRPPPKETDEKPGAPSISDMSADDMSATKPQLGSRKSSMRERIGRFGLKNAYTAKLPSVYKTEFEK